MDDLYLIGGAILTPYRRIPNGGVLIHGREIAAVFAAGEVDPPAGAQVIDLGGRTVVPGFIDLHLHGGGGADVMDGTAKSLIQIAEAHARHGTTAMLPTTLTSAPEDLFLTLDCVREARRQSFPGASILGVHLEGPYFASAQKGAQDERYIKNPDPHEYLRILDYSADIRRWSVAPELPGALELGRELKRRNILAAIGHSDACYDEVLRAVEAGYTHVTHLYSGMSMVHRVNCFRVLGVVESALLLDALSVEVIADGKHLPPGLLQLIYRNKGADRIALVTDAMRGAGMPDGKYLLGGLRDGQEAIVEDGVAWLNDRTAFAGSVATTDRLLRTMVCEAGVPLSEAVKMLTTTPARLVGIDGAKGALAPGMDADLVVLDERLTARLTMVEGRIVHQAL